MGRLRIVDYIKLGKTGLKVSVVCLGAGGRSRIGQSTGASFDQSVAIVKAAIDKGVTMVDTAARYGTEPIVGAALQGIRDDIVISSKEWVVKGSAGQQGLDFVSAPEFSQSVEQSLTNLKTDRIDILHLHGVSMRQYTYCVDEILPEMERLRQAGKIRFFGITEAFNVDTKHEMLQVATRTDVWDVIMVGLNFINQTALAEVLPNARVRGIGTLCMYAVRWGLVDHRQAGLLIEEAVKRGEIDRSAIDPANPLGFLEENGKPIPLTEAAYRFCRHAPGMDVILTGTSKLAHLEDNIRAIQAPPLPTPVLDRLRKVFGNVSSITGNPLTGGGG
jgi:L-galactose dehydrogenase